MEKKVCLICKIEKEIIKFDKHTNSSRRNVCEQCRNMRKRTNIWMAFLKVFDFKCQCCGEDDIRFLTLDHINNDGYKDSHDNMVILYRAKSEGFDKTKYTCLCYNCNCGKQRNKGICPHKGLDKKLYLEEFKQVGEHIINKGRNQIYDGDNVIERNKKAQAMFKLRNENPILYEIVKKELEKQKSSM